MRRLFAFVFLAAGCGGGSSGSGSGAPISMQFSQITGVMPMIASSYDASVPGTATIANGSITLDSKQGNIDFLVTSDNPTTPITVPIGEFCLVVNYTVTDDAGNVYAWGSSIPAGGMPGRVKYETTVPPYKISISNMQMIAATTNASGSFFIDGEASFN